MVDLECESLWLIFILHNQILEQMRVLGRRKPEKPMGLENRSIIENIVLLIDYQIDRETYKPGGNYF